MCPAGNADYVKWWEDVQSIGVIRPGDTLLLSTERVLTNDQADRIKTGAETVMPGVEVVVIGGLRATVLRADP